MKYSEEILENVERSKTIINDMIVKAREQGAKNFEMLFTLQDGLDELSMILKINQKVNSQFHKKWDSIMGWVPKVFEGHPLLDLLREIDCSLIDNA